ncbi:MAG: hypothetical protein JKX85_09410 [Phycisphaeraceae bacterium]|nr:hypothetical protein [Phycisphaeraceae bacterium]
MSNFVSQLAVRVKNKAKRLLQGTIQRSRQWVHLKRAQYQPLNNESGICYQSVRDSLTQVNLLARPIVNSMDFLPDRYSFSGMDFSDSPHVEFAHAYLKSGNDPTWDYTQSRYYQLAKAGRLPFPVKGECQARMRCQQFIWMIEQIKRHGYQPKRFGAIVLVDTTDSKWMVINGKHRLAALLALGEKNVDVFIGIENETRAQFRRMSQSVWPPSAYSLSFQAMETLGKLNGEKADEIQQLIEQIKKQKLETWANIYHPLPFYEFGNLTTQVAPDTPYQRLQMILDAAGGDVQDKRVLDLGCNLGFYSFSLAHRGANAIGVEMREDYHGISKKVVELYNMDVDFRKDLLTPELIDDIGDVDITLCFSMIQWVIEQQGMDYGKAILRKISQRSKLLLFDVSVNHGAAALTCPRGQEIIYVQNLLADATDYTDIQCVGKVHPYDVDTRFVFACRHPGSVPQIQSSLSKPQC